MSTRPWTRLAALALVVGASVACVPPAAARTTDVGLLSVDCATAQNCTALGYRETEKAQSPVVYSGAGRWGRGTTLRLPAGSRGAAFTAIRTPTPHYVGGQNYGMSCPAAGGCTVVGGYENSQHYEGGVLLSETGGRWPRGIKQPLPADAAPPHRGWPQPHNEPTSVSCGSAGNCTAVGYYRAHDHQAGLGLLLPEEGLLLTEVGGRWDRGVRAPLPLDAQYTPFNPVGGLELESVSCSAPGDCSAVGEYLDENGQTPGLLLTQTNGQWAAVRAPLARGLWADEDTQSANTYQHVVLEAVSCAAPGDCTAVGTYDGTRHRYGGLLLTQTGGVWAPGIAAPLPANADTRQWTNYTHVYLNSVSCSAPGDCSAVGDYVAGHGHQQGLLLTETDGVWAPGAEVQLPVGAWHASIGPAVTLKSVSCASPGNCTAVGGYYVGHGTHSGFVPLIVTETNGRWAAGVRPRLPAGAVFGSPSQVFVGSELDYAQSGLLSVSCPSASNCTAVGQFPHNNFPGSYWGLRLTQSHGQWRRGVWVKGA